MKSETDYDKKNNKKACAFSNKNKHKLTTSLG